MRRVRGLVGAMVVLCTTAAAIAVHPAAATAAAAPDRAAAAQLLVLVNRDRVANGLAPLAVSIVGTQEAEAWSGHMADTHDLAHNDDWFTPATKARANALFVGENVAINPDLLDAHRRLMISPHHRENILNARFDQVGIGAVFGPTGAWWVTEDFVESRRAVAPATVRAAPAPAVAPKPAPPAPPPPPPTTTTAPPPPTTVVPPTTIPPFPVPTAGDVAASVGELGAADGPPMELAAAAVPRATATPVSGASDALHLAGAIVLLAASLLWAVWVRRRVGSGWHTADRRGQAG